MRRLIKTYTLEPAGSHGVWGLDDHSFLPYIFGSAQYVPAMNGASDIPLEGSREGSPSPADVVKAVTVERERKKNMYFGAIGFIYDVKKGPFWEHSPILYDISGVPAGWAKINKVGFRLYCCIFLGTNVNPPYQGMIKMYNAEVLSKFPVVQHFRLGSLFSWDPNPMPSPLPISIQNLKPLSKGQVRSPETSILSRAPHQGAKLASTSAPWITQPPTKTLPVSSTAAARATQLSSKKTLLVPGTAAPWASRQPVIDAPVTSARKMTSRPVHDSVIGDQPIATQDNENLGTGTVMAPPPTSALGESNSRMV